MSEKVAAPKPKVVKRSKRAGKKDNKKKFTIDCSRAVENEIFDAAGFVSFYVAFIMYTHPPFPSSVIFLFLFSLFLFSLFLFSLFLSFSLLSLSPSFSLSLFLSFSLFLFMTFHRLLMV